MRAVTAPEIGGNYACAYVYRLGKFLKILHVEHCA
jgi:hypothetical protein